MSKGAILLLLLLLAGGYFIFTSLAGGSTVISTPSIQADAKVVQGDGGYTLVLEGVVNLPGEGDYEIQTLTTSLLVNGVSVQSKNFGPATVTGPSTYPFSFSPSFAPSAENVIARIEANVAKGKDVYTIVLDVPVALPDKTTLAKAPSVAVSLSSASLLGPTKSLTLAINIYNPNDAELSFDSLTLLYGDVNYDLDVDEIPAKSSTTIAQTLAVPADVTSMSITLSGSYTVNGVSKTISRDFDINVPALSEQPLQFDVATKLLSFSRDGFELNVFGSVTNPNAFNVTLESLSLRIVKNFGEGNIIQDVTLVENEDLLPKSSKVFSKTVNVSSSLTDAVAEVVATYNGKSVNIVSFPLPVVNPADFLDPVSVKLSVFHDGNSCHVTPTLTGPDYNADVVFSLDLNYGGSTVASKDYGEFVLAGSKTLDSVSVDVNGVVEASVTGEYGIRELGVWFPIRYTVELNCST